MEKDAILNIVINDVKELDLLMTTFKGKATIPQAYFRLINSKLNNIREEMTMLEELHNTSVPQNGKMVDIPSSAAPLSAQERPQPIEIKNHEVHQTEEIITLIEEKPTVTAQPAKATESDVGKQQPPCETTQTTKTVPQIEAEIAPVKKQETPEKPIVSSQNPQEPTHAATSQPHVVFETQQPNAVAEMPKATKSKTDKQILGETIGIDRKSLNETISNNVSIDDLAKIGSPVNDIRKALGINDRFYFQRELFDNNPTLFNNTLDQINSMGDYNQAYLHLKSNFKWDETLNETEEFLRAVRRRFL